MDQTLVALALFKKYSAQWFFINFNIEITTYRTTSFIDDAPFLFFESGATCMGISKSLFAWSLLWSWCTLCSTGTRVRVCIKYSTIGILACMHLVILHITIFKNRLQIIYHSYHQIENSDVRTTLQNITTIEQSW